SAGLRQVLGAWRATPRQNRTYHFGRSREGVDLAKSEVELRDPLPRLNVEDAIRCGGLLLLEQSDCHVVNRNSGSRLSTKRSMVRVSVQNPVGAVSVDYFGQSRSTHVRINFSRFAIHC